MDAVGKSPGWSSRHWGGSRTGLGALKSLSEGTPLLLEAVRRWMDTYGAQARLGTMLKCLRKKEDLVRRSEHVGASEWKLVECTESHVEAHSPEYTFCSWSS